MKCMPSLTFSYQENVLVYWIAAKIMQRLASNMISIINETQTTRITIINYDSYQDIVNASKTESKRNQNAIKMPAGRKMHVLNAPGLET